MRPAEFEIREGDALEVLKAMPSGIAQTCVTSPPYFGLRDYGHAQQLGAEATVAEYVERLVEILDEVGRVLRHDGTLWLNLGDSYGPDKQLLGVPWLVADALRAPRYTGSIRDERERVWLAAMVEAEGCMYLHRRKAGQHNGQGYNRKADSFSAGLEVASTDRAIVERCREIAGGGSISAQDKARRRTLYRWNMRSNACRSIIAELYPYLVAKQHEARLLLGCPSSGEDAVAAWQGLKALHAGEAVAADFPPPSGLYEQRWVLRKDVVWMKDNPMPEAVRDRPTSSHEHVFLFAKSPAYFYDLDGYREPSVSESPAGNGFKRDHRVGHGGQGARASDEKWQMTDTRQLRDVWRIPTVPFPGAHFAVFPPEIPLRCIRLGTSPRACHVCGSPWWRIVRRRRLLDGEPITGSWDGDGTGRRMGAVGVGHWRFSSATHELGWRPTCTCGAPLGVEPGDLDEIESPTGDGEQLDPTLDVGRKGLARPRNGEGGTRIVTRWEQRHYAAQLARSPHRDAMETEAGRETFAHYLRTDRSGARPPRAALLEAWRERGWLTDIEAPPSWWDEDDASRCLVIDPFAGAGTTGLVAVDEGRDFVGIELNAGYAQMARDRIADRAQAPRFEFL